jgi:hypothetical protein
MSIKRNNHHTISDRITRYKDYVDKDEMHLFYFYVGMNTAQQKGYNESFVRLLEENQNYPSVQSYLKGYLEGS